MWVIDMSTGEMHRWDPDQVRGRGMPDGYRRLDEVSGEELVPLLPAILRRIAEESRAHDIASAFS